MEVKILNFYKLSLYSLAALCGVGCLGGCQKQEETKKEEKQEEKTPAEKIAASENVIENSQDMLLYAVTGEADEDGNYDCFIEQDGEKIQWNTELAQEMMYISSKAKITTGKEMLATLSVGTSLLETGIESNSEIQFIEKETDNDQFSVTGKLTTGGITYALRENEDISDVIIETDNTTISMEKSGAARVTYQAGVVKVDVLQGSAKVKYDGKTKTVQGGKSIQINEAEDTISEVTAVDFKTFSLEGLLQTTSLGMYTLTFTDVNVEDASNAMAEMLEIDTETE